MSQDHPTSPAADLSYLRNLADAGKNAPLMAGPYLVAGGSWFAAASLTQWVPLREMLGLTPQQAMLAWLVAAAGFAAHLFMLLRGDRTKVENTNNRAINSAWSGIGYSIFAFWLGVTLMAYRSDEFFVMNSISLYVLSAYGVGWTLAANMTGRGWMQFNALMAFITVPVLGAFVGTGQEFLIYAIALILLAVVPGVRLMREARTAGQPQLEG